MNKWSDAARLVMAREQIIALVRACALLEDAVALVCTCKRFYAAVCGSLPRMSAIEACDAVRRKRPERHVRAARRHLVRSLQTYVPARLRMTAKARRLLARAAIDDISRRMMAAGVLARFDGDRLLRVEYLHDVISISAEQPSERVRRFRRAASLLGRV